MARLGLVVLGLLALAGAALASMTTIRFGDGDERRPRQPEAQPGMGGDLAIPVQGFARSSLADSWGDKRGGGRGHHGIDLMAEQGTPVVAARDGVVEKLFHSDLGGTTLYLRSPDRRWTYYYAHLAGYASGVREGLRVPAGQVLGYVGDTGDAGPGNYHLHFSASRTKPGQRWWEGEDVNPYPLLAERRGRR